MVLRTVHDVLFGRGYIISIGDTISTLVVVQWGDIISTVEGVQYCGGISSVVWSIPSVHGGF